MDAFDFFVQMGLMGQPRGRIFIQKKERTSQTHFER